MLAIAYIATKWVGMFATRHGRSGKKNISRSRNYQGIYNSSYVAALVLEYPLRALYVVAKKSA